MNTITAILAIPLILTLSSSILPSRWTKALQPAVVWLHFCVLLAVTWPLLDGSLALLRLTPDFAIDRLAALFMLLSCGVVGCCLTHAVYYFNSETHEIEERNLRAFYCAASLFLLAMTGVFACDSLGALWIAVELTTLSSAPLVYFDRTKDAVEATWKYLIICSVGIAFALMGTILIFAGSQEAIDAGSMSIRVLMANGPQLNTQLLHLGVIFCILGYGTKAGMFPLHNWLPDAHSEAPAPASAMLSGGLLNCALFAIWRVTQILTAAQQSRTITDIVIFMGAVTALAASLMLLRQQSVKRMWAYSSIENVGIMLVAIGLGSGTLFFLQALNHSVAKVALFLITGNIVQASGTKRLNRLHGVVMTAPVWAAILALGTFAVTGAPPFGMFVSELSILVSASSPAYWWVAILLLLAVSVSFIAVCGHTGRIICGTAMPQFIKANQVVSSLIPGFLIFCSFLLGFFIRPDLGIH
ncbi:MAG: hypothetical protein K2Z81_13910 [Cyanobacteria bacterium]|nr:hypothetical protein [Cyanobacteriota bacterium]